VRIDEADAHTAVLARLATLADTLVAGFDPVDLADHLVSSCLEFLPVVNAGIMLDDQRGHLRVLASSSEETRLLELFELQNNEGPCLEAFTSGLSVTVPDLATEGLRWPMFTGEAMGLGIVGAYALPMRLKERTIGALNLFCDTRNALSEPQLRLGQVMSTMATLGILNHWTVQRHEVLAEQLGSALHSRVVIEQAKGVIAERSRVTMTVAFEMLRTAARASRRPLTQVATEVVTRARMPTPNP